MKTFSSLALVAALLLALPACRCWHKGCCAQKTQTCACEVAQVETASEKAEVKDACDECCK